MAAEHVSAGGSCFRARAKTNPKAFGAVNFLFAQFHGQFFTNSFLNYLLKVCDAQLALCGLGSGCGGGLVSTSLLRR
jgi:hypothetical protein